MTNLKILLVDDDLDYQGSLKLVLENEGYLVETAASVSEAIKKLNDLFFDLALVDLRLTNDELDISGFKVAKEVAKKQIPCIVVTAFGSVDTVRRALISQGSQALAVDYVSKQAGTQALLDSIQKLHGITLVHISDLHPQILSSGEIPFDQETAFSQFIDDVKKQPGISGLYPIQAILVSGDISFQCQKNSFFWAKGYLENLANELKIPLEKIVLAPGNHDVDRKKAKTTKDSLEARTSGDAKWFAKFDKFLNFSYHFYGEPAFSRDKLYRLFTFDNRVAIAVFNSCLIEGDILHRCNVCLSQSGKEHYYGWIDRNQVKMAGKELDEMKWPGIRIGMFHHHIDPFETLGAEGDCKGDHLRCYRHKDYRLEFTFAEQGFRILLYGHRHKGDLYQPNKVGVNVPYHFGAGSFWKVIEKNFETASYLVLQLSPLEGKSRVIMRRYYQATNDRPGYWGSDDTINQDGIVRLPDVIMPTLDIGS